jgi:hypothetical protein
MNDGILERIHQALACDPRVAELGLQVTVAADKVFIMGTVETAERQAAVSEIAAEVLASTGETSYEIDNQTTIDDPAPPGAPEVLP